VCDFDQPFSRTSFRSADVIIEYVKAIGLTVDLILGTHAHADNLSAAPYLRENWRANARLATNSAKYGTLSRESDILKVSLTRDCDGDADNIVIKWQEICSLPVAPPHRQGVGTKPASKVVQSTFDAGVAIQYAGQRLICQITLHVARNNQRVADRHARLKGKAQIMELRKIPDLSNQSQFDKTQQRPQLIFSCNS